MTIVLEVDPRPDKLPALDLLARAGYVDITDVGDMEASIDAAGVLLSIGINPTVNIACNKRARAEIKNYIDELYRNGILDILVLAGNEYVPGESVRPTDLIRFISDYNPNLNVGSVVNPNSRNVEREIEVAQRKVEYGARFFLTQPVWCYGDAQMFYRALTQGDEFPAEIYWGIFPAKDYETVAKMEMPGVYVPEHIIAMSRNGTTGVEISGDLLQSFMAQEEHVYLMGRRYTTIEKILRTPR